MKNFFKIMFASMLGWIIMSIIGFFILMAMVASIISSSEEIVEVKQNSILHIQFEQPIVDRASNNPFDELGPFNFSNTKNMGLNNILESIEKAGLDTKIVGIFLDITHISSGISNAQEIRHALSEFKKSGKFIVAYGGMYSQTAYYVASVANKVFLHQIGSIDFKGLNMQVMFFKHLLSNIGVDMQVIRHGKFKSAVEPYLYDKMSPENRDQLLTLSTSIWNSMLEEISKDRNIEMKELNLIADSLSGFFAEKSLQHKLVDSLVIRQDVINYLMDQTKAKDEESMNLIALEKYNKIPKDLIKTKDKIAIIYAQGEIGMNKGNNNEIGTENIVNSIRSAAKDDNVKAIVLRVNSPGGSVYTSELIYNEVILAKEKKPVIASFGNYAASGGYYISCACDKIFSNSNTLTGSIGVFGVIPNAQKLLNDKIGVNFDEVNTNKNSGFISGTRKLTSYEEVTMYKNVESTYTDFIGKVAKGRKLRTTYIDSIGQGRVWSGTDAKRIGLVDEIGGLNEAVAEAAKISKLKLYKVVEYPKQKDLFTQLNESINNMSAKGMEKELGEFAYIYKFVKNAQQYQGIQARIPFIIQIK